MILEEPYRSEIREHAEHPVEHKLIGLDGCQNKIDNKPLAIYYNDEP